MKSARKQLLTGVCALFLVQVSMAQEAPKPAVPQEAPKPAAAAPTPAPAQTQTAKKGDPASAADSEGSSIGLFYWYNPSEFHLRTGQGAVAGNDTADLNYPGRNQPTPGVEVNLAVGRYSTLRMSYFRTKGHGGINAPSDLSMFGSNFSQGETISAKYTLQNGKLSWDYLSYPFPPTPHGWRLKTLWEVQYVSVKNELESEATLASKTIWFIYPTLGLGLEKRFSKNVRFELKGSGFMLPSRAMILDGQTHLAIRGGRIETLIGFKVFAFRTTMTKEEFVRATLPGAFLELRWHSKGE